MALDFGPIVIIVIVIGLVILSISVRRVRIRVKDSIPITITVISAMIFGILVMLMLYSILIGDNALFLIYQKIALFPILAVTISGYFYYESFITVIPPISRLIPMLVLFVFVLSFDIFNILNAFSEVYMNNLAIVQTFYLCTAFHIFAIIITRHVLKMWNRRAVKIDMVSLVVSGTSFFLVGLAFHLELAGIIIHFSIEQFIIIGAAMVCLITGMGILMVNNLKWGTYIFNIPVPIHVIMLYDSSGLLKYVRSVFTQSSSTIFKKDEILISGALQGFSTFFKEILGTNTKLSHIDAGSYEFYFSELPEGSGTLVVVASGVNYFVKRSLNQFSKGMTPELITYLKDSHSQGAYEKEFDSLVTKSFPYLVIDEKRIDGQRI